MTVAILDQGTGRQQMIDVGHTLHNRADCQMPSGKTVWAEERTSRTWHELVCSQPKALRHVRNRRSYEVLDEIPTPQALVEVLVLVAPPGRYGHRPARNGDDTRALGRTLPTYGRRGAGEKGGSLPPSKCCEQTLSSVVQCVQES
jgi:hypothetical protein